ARARARQLGGAHVWPGRLSPVPPAPPVLPHQLRRPRRGHAHVPLPTQHRVDRRPDGRARALRLRPVRAPRRSHQRPARLASRRPPSPTRRARSTGRMRPTRPQPFLTSAVRSPHVRPAPDEPRFSVGIALVGWLIALVFSNIGAVIILAAADYSGTDYDSLPLWLIAVLQVPLWVGLVGVVVVVSRRFGTGSLRRDYGFRFRQSD